MDAVLSVAVAGLTITQPRISGIVERQSDATQVTGYVDIYNLSPARAEQIYERSTGIVIQAGLSRHDCHHI